VHSAVQGHYYGIAIKIRREHRAKQGLASLMAIDFKEQEGGPETTLSDFFATDFMQMYHCKI
jgi:hypothetical protein